MGRKPLKRAERGIMINKRLVSLGLAAVMAASLMVGCSAKESGASEPSKQGTQAGVPADGEKAGEKVELTFFYPIGVGGALATLIENLCTEFTRENPDIVLNPVFAGNSSETMTKTISALQGGTPPDFAILPNPELYSLLSMDAVIPLDDLIAKDGGDEYINDFIPAFMKNSYKDGKVYSIPFQRSTIIMYYNKDQFREAGLDPDHFPETWEELRAAAEKLTVRDASGNVSRWGVMIPTDDPFIFYAFSKANSEGDGNIMSPDGKKVYFDTEGNVDALQFLLDLGKTDKVMPEGSIKWGDGPSNFMAGATAITCTSTGSLTNILDNTNFEVGTAFMPKSKQYGSPTGGANFYIFKGIDEKKQEAAWKFIRWITEPERVAQWSIDTGYVATRNSAYDTKLLKDYQAAVPQAKTGGDQLQYACSELMVYDNQRCLQALKNGIDSAMTGAATPEAAMKQAQAEADSILAQYQQ